MYNLSRRQGHYRLLCPSIRYGRLSHFQAPVSLFYDKVHNQLTLCERSLKLNTWIIPIKMKEGKKKKKKKKDDEDDEDLGKAVGKT